MDVTTKKIIVKTRLETKGFSMQFFEKAWYSLEKLNYHKTETTIDLFSLCAAILNRIARDESRA